MHTDHLRGKRIYAKKKIYMNLIKLGHHWRHIWMGMQDVAPSDAAAWKVTLTSLAVWMTKEAHCCPQY